MGEGDGSPAIALKGLSKLSHLQELVLEEVLATELPCSLTRLSVGLAYSEAPELDDLRRAFRHALEGLAGNTLQDVQVPMAAFDHSPRELAKAACLHQVSFLQLQFLRLHS